MTDIVKKSGGEQLAASTGWDPFRAMRDLLRWDPFREMAPLMPAFDRVAFMPTFDVTENNDGFVFKADVPGIKQENLEITTQGNRLQIKGKREHDEEIKRDAVYTFERQYGEFTRSFTLPDGVDISLAKSELKDGVLTLVIPKKPSAQAKKIEISAGKPKS